MITIDISVEFEKSEVSNHEFKKSPYRKFYDLISMLVLE